jgi:hypothetical protein
MMTLDACLAYYRACGLDVGHPGGSTPEHRTRIMQDFEDKCIAIMKQWSQEHADYTAIIHERDDGRVVLEEDWMVDMDAPHRFSVLIPGMELTDLWWMLDTPVVYNDLRTHTHRFGRRYETEDFCLRVVGQVIGVQPMHSSSPNDGAKVYMAIYKCDSENQDDVWEEPIENGFADWEAEYE